MKNPTYTSLSRAIPSLRHDPILAKLDEKAVEEMLVVLNDELDSELRNPDDASTIHD